MTALVQTYFTGKGLSLTVGATYSLSDLVNVVTYSAGTQDPGTTAASWAEFSIANVPGVSVSGATPDSSGVYHIALSGEMPPIEGVTFAQLSDLKFTFDSAFASANPNFSLNQLFNTSNLTGYVLFFGEWAFDNPSYEASDEGTPNLAEMFGFDTPPGGYYHFSLTAPTLSVTSVTDATAGSEIALSSLVTVSDPSNATYQLQLWDSEGTEAGGEFTINGVAQTSGHAINVPSGANVVFDAGTGASIDTLWAQLIQDNGAASGWEKFLVSVAAPTLSVTSVTDATAGSEIALSSLVTISDPSNATYQLQLWDSEGTEAGGEFLINDVAQTSGHAINVPSGANIIFDIGTGAGTDTLWAQLISNGMATGWEEFTVTVPEPSVSTTSISNATRGEVLDLSNLVTINDPGQVGYEALQLWDINGTAAGGQFVVNGVAQTGNHDINVAPADVAGTVYDVGKLGGADALSARLELNDGSFTPWQNFAVVAPGATLPILTVKATTIATGGQVINLSSLVTILDPDNVGYEALRLWDSNGTVAGGEFKINDQVQPANTALYVTDATFDATVFDAGTQSGTDALYAQLIQDNGAGTAWLKFSVAVPIPAISASSVSNAVSGRTISLSNLITISDPGSVGYQKLELWDSNGTVAGGEFLINGVAQTAGHAINVPAGANVVFDAGTGSGTDTLWAQLVQDNGALSGWKQFTVTVQSPTLSVTATTNTTAGAQIALSSLVTVSDPSNATYQLQLWDSDGTVAGGEFLINGVAQAVGHAINVPAGANVVFDAGTSAGTDILWAQLIQSNGSAIAWQKFTVTVPNPTVTVHNDTTATPGQTIALSNLVTISDPGNVGYQKLELWDSDGTAATGQFMIGGVAQTGGHEIDVSPANVASVVFDEGTTGNTDTLWAQLQLNNGTTIGWEKFTVVDPVEVAQGATLELTGPYAGQAIFAGNAGTLRLDDSTDFTGTVAGMTGADTIDLRDVGFNANLAPGYGLNYTANSTNTGGSLSLSDGTHSAQIALLGQYAASSFATASDGLGGTLISEALLSNSPQAALTQPHQA